MFGLSSGHRGRVLQATLLILLLVSARTGFAAQSGAGSVCDVRTTERIIAVGDVHGAHDQFVAILSAAVSSITVSRWIGGRAILVQTGDVLDRGPNSRKALESAAPSRARGLPGRRPRPRAARQSRSHAHGRPTGGTSAPRR